jgi:cytoskeleton protein RodZ
VNSTTTEQEQEGGTLGRQLRRAREARGVSLREISEHTRITIQNLEAIEADDYKHLPGGIFNRSFIRAYARYIGFDEARALDLYAQGARERGEHAEEPQPSHRSRVYTGEATRSPLSTALLSLFILGLFALVVYAGLHYYRRTGDGAPPSATPTPAADAQAATAPTPQPTPEAAQDFRLQVKSRGRAFWLTSWADEEKKRGRFVTSDKPEEFAPRQSLNLFYDRASADALEVTVNGQPLRTPGRDGADREVTWTITRDNYRQFLP